MFNTALSFQRGNVFTYRHIVGNGALQPCAPHLRLQLDTPQLELLLNAQGCILLKASGDTFEKGAFPSFAVNSAELLLLINLNQAEPAVTRMISILQCTTIKEKMFR